MKLPRFKLKVRFPIRREINFFWVALRKVIPPLPKCLGQKTPPRVYNRKAQFCPHINEVILFQLPNETTSSVVLPFSGGSRTKLLPDKNQNCETRKHR